MVTNMSRKPGFPNSSCSIKLPDGNLSKGDSSGVDANDEHSYKKRQQLISFGHKQWGFNNWSWGVTKQDLDFVDFSNGKYCAGVVAFVSIDVKSLGIHREDVGYATCVGPQKGSAVHSARKCSVTNALRETFLSFGGEIATSLMELLELGKADGQIEDGSKAINDIKLERNSINRPTTGNNITNTRDIKNEQPINPQRKDSSDSSASGDGKNANQDKKSPQKQSTSNKNSQPMTDIHNNQSSSKSNGLTANHNHNKIIPPTGAALVPPHVPVGGIPPPPMGVRPTMPLHPSNISKDNGNDIEMLSEEEMRAERKRRQKQKQEEFKRKLQNSV